MRTTVANYVAGTVAGIERDELLTAGDRNLADTLRLYGRTAPGAVVADDGGLLLVSTLANWPGPYHNGALRLDRSMAPAEVLARAAAFFAGRAPGYCVWIAAHADADLEEAALAGGYAAVSDKGTPRLALLHPIAPPEAPAGVTLDEVVDDAGRRAYLAVTIEAYADSFLPPDAAEASLATVAAVAGPGVRAVVARLGGAPVAAAMAVADDGVAGDGAAGLRVAGIQMVGTVPAARGRGLGELCTRWAVAAGFDSGARAVVLEASEAGDPLYRRMGFTEVSRYRWCFGPPRPPRPPGDRSTHGPAPA